jgi:hypothetical protein
MVRPPAWCFWWPTSARCLAVGPSWLVCDETGGQSRKGTAEGGGWPSRYLAIKVRSSRLRAAKAASGPIRCGAFFSHSSTTAATRPSASILRWTRVPRWASTLYLTRVGPAPPNFAVYRRRAHSFPPLPPLPSLFSSFWRFSSTATTPAHITSLSSLARTTAPGFASRQWIFGTLCVRHLTETDGLRLRIGGPHWAGTV